MRSSWYQNAPFAFWIVDVLRPGVLVELGAHHGFSYLCFCQAVDTLDTGTHCIAVDSWTGDEHSGFYESDVLDELRSIHDGAYGRFSRLVQGTFDDAVGHITDRSIDLLHIDGRHRYEDVRHDFETWLPKLSERAVVLFHDIDVRERGFGVYRFWEELKNQYPTFTILDEHGLGVAGVGDNQADHLTKLFAATKDSDLENEIRRVYQRLGWAVTASIGMKSAEAALAAIQVEDTSLLAQIAAMREQLSQAADQMERLQHDATAIETELSIESGVNVELLEQIDARIAEIQAAETKLLELSNSNSHLSARFSEISTQLSDELARSTDLEKENLRYRHDLDRIYSSKAWAVIARLRRLRPG